MSPGEFRHQQYHHRKRETHMSAPTPTRSNLGPLITPFAPPSHCSRAIFGCETCSTAWHALSCNKSKIGLGDNTSCWPPATSYPPHSEPYLSGLGFYSPGLVCPTSYYNACTAISTLPSQKDVPDIITKGPMKDGSFQFPLVEGETAMGCCPIGYTCATYPSLGWQSCHRVVSSTQLSSGQAGTCENGEVKEMEVDANGRLDFWAPLIQINWQASDRGTDSVMAAAEPTQSATSTAWHSHSMSVPQPSVVAGPTFTAPTASPTAESTSLPAPKSTLSTQAITGISVSLALASLTATAFIIWLWFRRRDPDANRRSSIAPEMAGKPSTAGSSMTSSPSLKSSGLAAGNSSAIAPGTGKVHHFAAFSTAAPHARSNSLVGARTMSPFSVQSEISPIDDRDLEFPLPPGTASTQGGHVHSVVQPQSPLRLGAEDVVESPIDGRSPFRLTQTSSLMQKGERSSWRDSWRNSLGLGKGSGDTDRSTRWPGQ